MASELKQRLDEMGLSLPAPLAPQANYTPFIRSGDTLYISGQLPLQDGKLLATGRLGDGVSVEQGVAAARLCGLHILAQALAAVDDDAGRLVQIVKLTGFVSSTPDFAEQPKVINGASDLLATLLGDAGRHARSAVGVAALPLGAPVEIEAIVTVS